MLLPHSFVVQSGGVGLQLEVVIDLSSLAFYGLSTLDALYLLRDLTLSWHTLPPLLTLNVLPCTQPAPYHHIVLSFPHQHSHNQWSNSLADVSVGGTDTGTGLNH